MKIIQCYKDHSVFWVRIFGRGILIKNTNYYKPLFSERNNLKGFRFKNIYFELLK